MRQLIHRALIICGLLFAGAIHVAAQPLEVAGVLNFVLEGPTADADGNVYFTDVNASRILKLGTDGRITTFRQPANRANGMVFDGRFRLLIAEMGDPANNVPGRVTRTDMMTGKIEVLSDRYEGIPFRDTNDITIDGQGRIYFTNNSNNAWGGVYRIDTDGKLKRLMASLDDRTLYVIETNQAAGGNRRISAFDLSEDGTVSNPRVFHDFYPGRSGDGMSIDSEGNLWVAAGLNRLRGTSETLATKVGVHVFSPNGKLIHHIPVHLDLLTNTAFGGPDLKTLYITAGNTIFRVPVKVAGTRR